MSLKKRTVHIGKKTMWRWGQKLGWCSYNQRKTKSCWQPPKTKKKAKNRLFLSTSRRTNPDNDLNADFCLHNCDRLNLYCFNPPSLWWIKFVMADLGHKYSRKIIGKERRCYWFRLSLVVFKEENRNIKFKD